MQIVCWFISLRAVALECQSHARLRQTGRLAYCDDRHVYGPVRGLQLGEFGNFRRDSALRYESACIITLGKLASESDVVLSLNKDLFSSTSLARDYEFYSVVLTYEVRS